jgi:hypothetical protein
MPDNELSLVSTEDLVAEIAARCDASCVVLRRDDDATGSMFTIYRFLRGDHHVCLGLLTDMTDYILRMALEDDATPDEKI